MDLLSKHVLLELVIMPANVADGKTLLSKCLSTPTRIYSALS